MATLKACLIGGGGGKETGFSGGGGAGGYVYNSALTVTSQTYSVVVGAGGEGLSGEDSTFGGLTAYGGGSYVTWGGVGGDGGCGGGGYSPGGAGWAGGTGSQGGNGATAGSGWTYGGGGGGAGASASGKNGGDGVVNPIAGSTAGENVGGVYYLAGGGGGNENGTGGKGGGRAGTTYPSGNVADATANTGGGAGGGANTVASNGGSGVVILSWVTADFGTCSVTGAGNAITTSGSNSIATFITSGDFVCSIPYTYNDINLTYNSTSSTYNGVATFFSINVSDSINISENLSKTGGAISINIYDSINVSENVTSTISALAVNKYDSINISESVTSTISTLAINKYDSVNISENVTRTISTLTINIFDSINISENLGSAGVTVSINVFDSINISESITMRTLTLAVNKYDYVNISENLTETIIILPVNVYDSINISENLTDTGGTLPINVYDSINISESVTRTISTLAVSVTDSINISESVTRSISTLTVSVFDSINISENLSNLGVSFSVNVSDNVNVSDSVTGIINSMLGGISTSDTLNVFENFGSNGWLYKVKITVDHTKVSGDLTSYPVYINLADFPLHFFTNVKTDGSDIRVYKYNNSTELPFELVSIGTVTKTGELYFKADLSTTYDTDFYVWYGNPSASAYARNDTYGSDNVWGSNAKYVGHFNTNSNDSSVSANNGTQRTITTGASTIAGSLNMLGETVLLNNNAGTDVIPFGKTAGYRMISQSFVCPADLTLLKSITMRRAADTGTFSASITARISTDNAGIPGSTVVSMSYTAGTGGSWPALSTSLNSYLYAECALTPGATYWLSFEKAVDASNYPNVYYNASGTYGTLKAYDGATWNTVAGNLNFALATADEVKLASRIDLTYNNFSISWKMKRNASLYENIMSVGRGDGSGYISVDNSLNTLHIESTSNNVWDKNIPSGITVDDNTWHYYTVTSTGSNFLLYVDGSLARTQIAITDTVTQKFQYIGTKGAYPYIYGRAFTGSLDEIRFFNNTILSASHILADYRNQSSSSTFYTVSYTDTIVEPWLGDINVFDSINISEDFTRLAQLGDINVSDTLNITENYPQSGQLGDINVSDTLNITENYPHTGQLGDINASDTINLTDIVSTEPLSISISVIDSIIIGEYENLDKFLEVRVIDALDMSEYAKHEHVHEVIVNDSIAINETLNQESFRFSPSFITPYAQITRDKPLIGRLRGFS